MYSTLIMVGGLLILAAIMFGRKAGKKSDKPAHTMDNTATNPLASHPASADEIYSDAAEENCDTAPEGLTESDSYQMEEAFFERAREGSRSIPIANLYHTFDIMFLKSIFESEGIPFRVDFEHFNKLRGGIPIGTMNNAILHILEEDYADAIAVLEDYRASKAKDSPHPTANRVRNLAEFAIGSWAMPAAADSHLDILYQDENSGDKG